MTAERRTERGGRVTRGKRLAFRFDGREFTGFPGDTLASALLANGIDVVGRSVKYHRRRGVFAIGSEEPNALVRVGSGAEAEPNSRATMLPLVDGLEAWSQNSWPAPNFDAFATLGRLGPLLSAGFYYKTFMWPRRAWMTYERVIRKVAGLGDAPAGPDPGRYEHAFAHCDVLVVGAGPAGLRAARVAAEAGADVWLVDENPWVGGWLNRERATIGEQSGSDWADEELAYLRSLPGARVLTQTTAFGFYDHNLVGLVELLPSGGAGEAGQRLWKLRASRVVIATGAIERPLVFAGNDLPGIMLAGAVRGYLNQFGVLPSSRLVIATNNDSAYRTAMDAHDAGITVTAIVDSRPAADPGIVAKIRRRNIPLLMHHAVFRATGSSRVRNVSVCELSAADRAVTRLECSALAVSGGWSPTIHLHSQAGGTSKYDEATASVLPAEARHATHLAGAILGHFGLGECLDDGTRAGAAAAEAAGFKVRSPAVATGQARLAGDGGQVSPLWETPDRGHGKAFVDLQNDVTRDDVGQAYREGYQSVEHLKRYTTLGMGTDQGKTSNINGLALLAGHRQASIATVGTTTFRPPYTPVTLGAVAGPDVRARLDRVRRSPLHSQHEQQDAVFDYNALWLRPSYYPVPGERMADAVHREARAVRSDCGIVDVSTLGKFEVQGPDAGRFLERVYLSSLARLRPRRIRYGLMLREDGIIFDDGTVTCWDEGHYFLTVSTGHAEHVHEHLSYFREVCAPDLDVAVTCVTEFWAAVALAGPRAAVLLRQVAECSPGIDELTHMSAAIGTVAGIPARLLRVSFSGEWACEIYVPARQGPHLWSQLLRHGAVPYGLEAMDVLRIEKGFIGMGTEANGRTSPLDLGFDRMAGKRERHVGQHGLRRVHGNGNDRLQLVGLVTSDANVPLEQDAQLVGAPDKRGFGSSIGHISSAAFSPALGRYVALALLRNGRSRMGESVYVADPVRTSAADIRATVCPPCFFDPDGTRMRP